MDRSITSILTSRIVKCLFPFGLHCNPRGIFRFYMAIFVDRNDVLFSLDRLTYSKYLTKQKEQWTEIERESFNTYMLDNLEWNVSLLNQVHSLHQQRRQRCPNNNNDGRCHFLFFRISRVPTLCFVANCAATEAKAGLTFLQWPHQGA